LKRAVIRRRLEEFPGGWVAGDFSPALLKSKEMEVSIKHFEAGCSEPEHYQRSVTEITIVLRGQCVLAGEVLTTGDILVVPPFLSGSFLAETEVLLLVLKSPSIPGDKVVGQAGRDDE
jgi:quercetin dioxygenase-like cupin family protein